MHVLRCLWKFATSRTSSWCMPCGRPVTCKAACSLRVHCLSHLRGGTAGSQGHYCREREQAEPGHVLRKQLPREWENERFNSYGCQLEVTHFKTQFLSPLDKSVVTVSLVIQRFVEVSDYWESKMPGQQRLEYRRRWCQPVNNVCVCERVCVSVFRSC